MPALRNKVVQTQSSCRQQASAWLFGQLHGGHASQPGSPQTLIIMIRKIALVASYHQPSTDAAP